MWTSIQKWYYFKHFLRFINKIVFAFHIWSHYSLCLEITLHYTFANHPIITVYLSMYIFHYNLRENLICVQHRLFSLTKYYSFNHYWLWTIDLVFQYFISEFLYDELAYHSFSWSNFCIDNESKVPYVDKTNFLKMFVDW